MFITGLSLSTYGKYGSVTNLKTIDSEGPDKFWTLEIGQTGQKRDFEVCRPGRTVSHGPDREPRSNLVNKL